MNDIPIPDVLKRLPPSDVFCAITRAGVYLDGEQRAALRRAMRDIIAENQERYRERRRAA